MLFLSPEDGLASHEVFCGLTDNQGFLQHSAEVNSQVRGIYADETGLVDTRS
ncbi:hypothetical protein [Paraflavitalea pollutisoli]|uniref:hypothetical protein n=1 Tax=Paraflavitalea pollutisoli TaxID=3034143 RepID=UPI0023EE1956|nr:hypothetical protein [Paraflavitalea sp. H1-2-19X]